jgi:hypothetical protein
MTARIFRLTTIIAIVLSSLVAFSEVRAHAEATLSAEAADVSLGAVFARDPSGATAWAVVAAVRTAEAGATLRIRLCPQQMTCREFHRALSAGEFVMGATGNVAQIAATVDGLGEVALVNYSHGFPATFAICPNDQTRSMAAATGGPVSNAGIAVGGTLGDWKVEGGGCGFNGVNATMVWLLV